MTNATPTTARLLEVLRHLAGARVLVIGDLIYDEFVWGRVSRISPEAPVPVVDVRSESAMPGGAANVANNICALGGRTAVAGVVGEDRAGSALMAGLRQRQIDVGGVVLDHRRPTTVKTRVIAHHQQVVRIDREVSADVDSHATDRMVDYAREHLMDLQGIIIEDYGKGVVVPRLIQELVRMGRDRQMLLVVDPKEQHVDLYAGVTVITPNRYEASRAAGIPGSDLEAVNRVGEALLKRLRCRAVLVTLGEDGMCLFEADGGRVRIPTVAREVFDVAGAGDTVVAAFTLALASGASFVEAAHIANFAAGVVVGKVGTGVATVEELERELSQGATIQHVS